MDGLTWCSSSERGQRVQGSKSKTIFLTPSYPSWISPLTEEKGHQTVYGNQCMQSLYIGIPEQMPDGKLTIPVSGRPGEIGMYIYISELQNHRHGNMQNLIDTIEAVDQL